MSTHRKGISSVQVGRDIGVTQKTAWFMMQRVRNAFKMQSFTYTKIGGENPVEADESFIQAKPSNMHKKKREAIETLGSRGIAIAGAIERGGEIRAQYIERANYENLVPFLVKNVHQGSKLMTYEHVAYQTMQRIYEHQTIWLILRKMLSKIPLKHPL